MRAVCLLGPTGVLYTGNGFHQDLLVLMFKCHTYCSRFEYNIVLRLSAGLVLWVRPASKGSVSWLGSWPG